MALGLLSLTHVPFLSGRTARGRVSPAVSPRRALRVRKKMSGERMPVKMIGDILTAQLPHMQPYIRFCSCQLNGAALIQQKTDEAPDFKDFVKVRSRAGRDPAPSGRPGPLGVSGANSRQSSAKGAAVQLLVVFGFRFKFPSHSQAPEGGQGPGFLLWFIWAPPLFIVSALRLEGAACSPSDPVPAPPGAS